MCSGFSKLNIKVLMFLLTFLIPVRGYAESMCAEVKIQINQEAAFERQAFDARMKINNGMSSISIEDVNIKIKFTDKNGNPVSATTDSNSSGALFFYKLESKKNIDKIDGNGEIGPSKSAEIHWLIIPSPGAAGKEGIGEVYNVGAELSYTLAGEKHEMEVVPDFILVKPMPDLVLDYFLPKEVYGDDPFTEETEPSIPFNLGLRVKNQGKGSAKKLKIDSAQPKIIENKQGLLIDFLIEGSSVNDQEASPTLLADIGDLESGKTACVNWRMTVSLAGRFDSFSAVVTHSDELGGSVTSLIKPENTNTHELVHNVIADIQGRDRLTDFLGKSRNGSVYKVYESNGNDIEVKNKIQDTSVKSSGSKSLNIEFQADEGFVFTKISDPFLGRKVIRQAVRSDGKIILKENIWLSSKMREGNWEYFINLFDVKTPGQYTVYFASDNNANKAPIVESIENKTVLEEEKIDFIVKASDPDGDKINLMANPLPPGAAFVKIKEGESRFTWNTSKGQSGVYRIFFSASDGKLTTREIGRIQINSLSDTDLDGMDDSWELKYFGTLDRDGTGDFDNDGILDIDEYRFGTDPASSNSPTEPEIISPVNTSVIKTYTPSFIVKNSVDPDEDVVTYDFELYSDEQMTKLVKSNKQVKEGVKKTVWNPGMNLNENTFYHWRVRAGDNKGCSQWVYGDFFVNKINEQPGIFSVFYPENQEEVTSLNPKLIVNNSKDPDFDDLKYRFKISADQQMNSIIASSGEVPAGNENKTEWMMGISLEENKRYWWQVTAEDESGLLRETSVNSFFVNVKNDAPEKPYIVTPVNKSENTEDKIEIKVKNSLDADGDNLKYQFMIDTSMTFDSPNLIESGEIDEQSEFTSWQVSSLRENTWYFIRVKADDGSACSMWSDTSFFQNKQNEAPAKPVIKNPGNNSWVNTLTPTLEVFKVKDPDEDKLNYRFKVYEKRSLENPVLDKTETSNTLIVSAALKDNHYYSWKVMCIDEHGLESSWTELSGFFTDNNGVNDEPVLEFTCLTDKDYTNKDIYKIIWTDNDPDSNAKVSLYYSHDNSGNNKILITDNLSEDADGENDEYLWDIKNIPDGEYYIFGLIEDEENQNLVSTKDKIRIDRTDPEVKVFPAGGTYYGTISVQAESSEPGKIYYTRDTTEPDINSMVYSESIKIARTTTLKFAALDKSGNLGPVKTEKYIINEVPSIPELKSPQNQQWVNSLEPVVEVHPSDHSAGVELKYEFKVYRDKNLSDEFASGESANEKWKVYPQLVKNHSYYWVSRAVDSNNMVSAWSKPFEFYVNLSSLWQSKNIGHCWKKGSFLNIGNRFEIEASGFDIWGMLDTFKFTCQPSNKDCEITARVESIVNTHDWAKAGLMIRDSFRLGSKHVMIAVTPENGIAFQYRKRTGWISKHESCGEKITAPYWLKLKRTGNTFTSYISENGTNWVRSGQVEISMSDDVFIGMAVTSHNNLKICKAVFTDTKIDECGD